MLLFCKKKPIDVHIVDLCKDTNVKMVEIRRKRQILTCTWRNIKKGILKTGIPLRETRHNDAPTIYLPVPKTEPFKKSVNYYGAALWNTLPVETRLSDSIEDFKIKLYKET